MQYWLLERGLNVNKNLVATATGIVILALGAFGCQDSDKKYEYEVSGVVEAVQTDYECGEDLALEPAAFPAGKGKGSSGSRSKTSGSSSESGASSAQQGGGGGNVAASKPPSRKTEAPLPHRTSKAPAASTARPNGDVHKSGVQLSKKPAKPKRVTRIVPPKESKRPEGCETEYEVFVRNGDGLFEQDVRKVDYIHCSDQVREQFPACTEG
jgi:hypothetical protein